MESQTEGEMLVSFFIVDAHRNEILLRYFCMPNYRSAQVNGQIAYARFFYNCTRARRLPFKELFIQVPFAFACKRLRFHSRLAGHQLSARLKMGLQNIRQQEIERDR
jgi:hypothetical protein